MSKKVKVFLVILSTIIASGIGLWLLKPKKQDNFVQKEISIKQAKPVEIKNIKYNDEAGFEFEFPEDLIIKPIELTNPQVYSSLEITSAIEGKLTLRIADTTFKTTSEWIAEFEKNNFISDLTTFRLDDLTGINFIYGVPKNRLGIIINDGIIYTIESPGDDGYWDRARDIIINSFKFKPEVFENNENKTEPDPANKETITLIEENLE